MAEREKVVVDPEAAILEALSKPRTPNESAPKGGRSAEAEAMGVEQANPSGSPGADISEIADTLPPPPKPEKPARGKRKASE